jgi:hypothetical protein
MIISNQTYGQDSTFRFDKSKNNISIGYDFKKLRKPRSSSGFGPMFIKYERAISKNIGLGAMSYFHYEKTYSENDGIVFSNGEFLKNKTTITGFSVIPKINWHFDMSHFKNKNIQKFDLYLGAGIGYGFEAENSDYLMKDEGENNANIYFSFLDEKMKNHFVATEFNLGIRYYALNNFGAYFELGFGASRAQFGLIYKW